MLSQLIIFIQEIVALLNDHKKTVISFQEHSGFVHQMESCQPWKLLISEEVYLHYIHKLKLFVGR